MADPDEQDIEAMTAAILVCNSLPGPKLTHYMARVRARAALDAARSTEPEEPSEVAQVAAFYVVLCRECGAQQNAGVGGVPTETHIARPGRPCPNQGKFYVPATVEVMLLSDHEAALAETQEVIDDLGPYYQAQYAAGAKAALAQEQEKVARVRAAIVVEREGLQGPPGPYPRRDMLNRIEAALASSSEDGDETR